MPKSKEEPTLNFASALVHAFNHSYAVDEFVNPDGDVKDPNDMGLVYTSRKVLKLKDFNEEVHAKDDIEIFSELDIVRVETEDNLSVDKVLKNLVDECCSLDRRITKDTKDAIMGEIFSNSVGDEAEKEVLLKEVMQGYHIEHDAAKSSLIYDQRWVVATCKTEDPIHPKICISRTKTPVHIGHSEETRLIVLVIVPSAYGELRSAVEIARTFSTLLKKNTRFVDNLINCDAGSVTKTQTKIAELVKEEATRRAKDDVHKQALERDQHRNDDGHHGHSHGHGDEYGDFSQPAGGFRPWYMPGKGIYIDIKRRWPDYYSDWTDGWIDAFDKEKRAEDRYRVKDNWIKLLRGTFVILALISMPLAAFGQTNAFNTDNQIDVERTFAGQVLGGMIFCIFASQPLGIVMTTPPITLIIHLVHLISENWEADFGPFYSMTGIFVGCWMMLAATFNFSRFMKWITPSIEEMFGIFVAWAFCYSAMEQTKYAFQQWYHDPTINCTTSSCQYISPNITNVCEENSPADGYLGDCVECGRAKGLLWLILMFSTFNVSVFLFTVMKHTTFFTSWLREYISTYAQLFTVVGITVAYWVIPTQISFYPFILSYETNSDAILILQEFWDLDSTQVAVCFGCSLPFALLFFFDQGFSSMVTNGHKNKLEKAGGYHWDLFLVGAINVFMSLFGLPWLHMALPHSDIHVKNVADTKDVFVNNNLHTEIKSGSVLEQRLTTFAAYALMMIYMIPAVFHHTFMNIPIPVLLGVFWFQAIVGLYGNEVLERMMLLFAANKTYGSTHYTKRVPFWNINVFSLCCVVQVAILIYVGFYISPYAKLGFPFLIPIMIIIRHYVLPYLINDKTKLHSNETYLDILDSH